MQAPLNAQESLVIIKTHSALTALRHIAHMKIFRDTSRIIEQDRFIALETAGTGNPLVGELECLVAGYGECC